MSDVNYCPYCLVKEKANVKMRFETDQQNEGRCNCCGAYIDKGQTKVDINGYADIYKGCLALLDDMAQKFRYWLEVFGVDIEDYEDDYNTSISISQMDIISRLFVNAGHTTLMNVAKAIGVEGVSEPIEFQLYRETFEP